MSEANTESVESSETVGLRSQLSRPDNPLHHVPIELIVVIGKARPKISDLVNFKQNSVIPLNTKIDDLVEIYVGSKLIARGELQENQQGGAVNLAVRLTEVVDMRSTGA